MFSFNVSRYIWKNWSTLTWPLNFLASSLWKLELYIMLSTVNMISYVSLFEFETNKGYNVSICFFDKRTHNISFFFNRIEPTKIKSYLRNFFFWLLKLKKIKFKNCTFFQVQIMWSTYLFFTYNWSNPYYNTFESISSIYSEIIWW